MSLNAELTAVVEGFYTKAPKPIVDIINRSVVDLKAVFNPKSTIQVGDTLPPFNLNDALGNPISSANLLAKGPLLITFYRGEWCPFCNLALRALQKHLDEFHAKGVTLVAITPELPGTALTTVEKNDLKFPILSDVGHKFARQLGIVWKMPENLRPVFEKIGHDLIKSNGDDSFEVPIPATLLVDGKGVVKNTYIEPDYRKRAEPDMVIEWLNVL